jgi:DNA polymerase
MTERTLLSEDINDFCFIDTETRSNIDVTVAGVERHMDEGFVSILTYAIGDAPVQDWCVPSWAEKDRLDWENAPDDLYCFLRRALDKGDRWFVAWNSGFDRKSISRGIVCTNPAAPELAQGTIRARMMVDAMAQAVKSHLPPDLMGASQMNGSEVKKQSGGKALIKMFADGSRPETPASNPVEWGQFRSYARDDVAAMRDIWQTTLPLDVIEWEEFWVNELINDRGLPMDEPFVAAAADLAARNSMLANEAVVALSGGALRTVNQHAAILDWIEDKIGHLSSVERILTREVVMEPGDDGEDLAVVKKSLSKDRVEELILLLEKLDETEGLTDDEFTALQMLEVRQYGASATPGKFGKALGMLHGGRVKGQYVFNGAPATGRYSSRGLQVHNLTRATVGDRADEIEALEMITFGGDDVVASYDALKARFGPVGRTLSRLIRPAILAPEGCTMFSSDWSAIEARALPWLSDSDDGDAVLDVFLATDKDPSLPDIYKVQAGGILHIDPLAVSKAQRQSHGKVPVLSLGFGGGKGALFAMARNYGVSFGDEEAGQIVKDWREVNPWARAFWDDVWAAALGAMEHPGEEFIAGRLTYVYIPEYRKGSLFCFMPCGRALIYPSIRWERRDVKNKFTGEIETKNQLTYRRGRGRAVLWYGTLAENATQGICGSLLRWALVEFEHRAPGLLIGHTHDEIIGMCPVSEADGAAALLSELMGTGPAWAAGLPLASEAEINDWYTKTEA